MELNLLLHYLHLSYYYVHKGKPAQGRMDLTCAVKILRLYKNDYSDALDMYIRACTALAQLKNAWRGERTRGCVLDSLEIMIDQVEGWCAVSRAA